jgi:hypothetical protein
MVFGNREMGSKNRETNTNSEEAPAILRALCISGRKIDAADSVKPRKFQVFFAYQQYLFET